MRQRTQPRRFRPMLMLIVLALIALWYAYEQCGGGGLFGPGSGGLGPTRSDEGRSGPETPDRVSDKKQPDVRPAIGPRRCKLRLDAKGLSRDEQPSTVEEAVTACKQAGGADLTVTGDALSGERRRVLDALDRAGVEVFERQPGSTVPEK